MNERTKAGRFGGSLVIITPKTVAEGMDDARAVMRSHRNAFRELAR